MPPPNTHPNSCGRAKAAHCALWTCLLSVLAGCQTPPAHPETGATGHGDRARGLVIARQIAEDTAVQTATQPLQTGGQAACDVAGAVCRAGQEWVCKRLLLPLSGPPGPVAPERLSLDPDCLEAVLHKVSKHGLQAALVAIDLDGEPALRHLEGLIDGAGRRIDVLVYQWDSDALGWSMAQRLASRAACLGANPDGGPTVRVLVDGGGTLIHAPPEKKCAGLANEVLGWLERQPHVQVLRTRNGLGHFDHRKLVVIDGCVAWSGGRNFTLASFFEYHDISYILHGSLVYDLAGCFEASWREAGGEPSPLAEEPPPLEQGNAWARVVGTGRFRRDLSRVVYEAVDHAWHHVYLENPYLTDSKLVCKLIRARRRGADVRVILAQDSQSHVIDRALRVTTNRLLKAGIRVYTYPATTHVKAASVDGRWAYFGTGNFDNLSFHRNNEVGLAVGAGPVIGELEERLFLADFRPEWEITCPLPTDFGDYLAELLVTVVL